MILDFQVAFHAPISSFIGKVEKQNKAMKMFCNKRLLEAAKLVMFSISVTNGKVRGE